jgi:hypothetical protein
MELIDRVIRNLEETIEGYNKKRIKEDGFRLAKAKIILLGQFCLLANPKGSSLLEIPATIDVDAKIEADYTIKRAFKLILKHEGLDYDEDSHLIWIPPESTFDKLHDSPLLEVSALSPIYAILSKAIKAKEKNRILVGEAMGVFGKKLIDLIKKYGGNPEYFLKDKA